MNEVAKVIPINNLTIPKNYELALLGLSWAEHWVPSYGTDRVDEARKWLPVAELSLKPMDTQEVMVRLLKTLSMFKTTEESNNSMDALKDCFEEMPADLVVKSLSHVEQTCKFFPKAADFNEPIIGEWNRRKAICNHLKWCISTHDRQERRIANLKGGIVGERENRKRP